MSGGYDDGYTRCPCFWGTSPGRLIVLLEAMLPSLAGIHVLDAGAGEGKNAAYLAERGALVDAVELSSSALHNAHVQWPQSKSVNWIQADIRQFPLKDDAYDVVLMYGLFHCLSSVEEITTLVDSLERATPFGGYHVICAFNDRHQDLSAHSGFAPLLLRHEDYLDLYSEWDIVYATDEDLHETHPHNSIPHVHSMTRIIARKVNR